MVVDELIDKSSSKTDLNKIVATESITTPFMYVTDSLFANNNIYSNNNISANNNIISKNSIVAKDIKVDKLILGDYELHSENGNILMKDGYTLTRNKPIEFIVKGEYTKKISLSLFENFKAYTIVCHIKEKNTFMFGNLFILENKIFYKTLHKVDNIQCKVDDKYLIFEFEENDEIYIYIF